MTLLHGGDAPAPPLVVKDTTSLVKSIEQAVNRLRDKPAARWSLRSGAFFATSSRH